MQHPGSIRKYRLAKGYKQGTLAEMVGERQQTISSIEWDKTKLRIDVAEKLAIALDVAVSDIYYNPLTELPRPPATTHITKKELLQQLLHEKDKLLDEKDKRLEEKDKQIALLLQMLEEEKKKKK